MRATFDSNAREYHRKATSGQSALEIISEWPVTAKAPTRVQRALQKIEDIVYHCAELFRAVVPIQ